MRTRIRIAVLWATLGVALGVGGFAVAQELSTDNIRETSVSEGTPIDGLRPTGVGLPEVGVEGTLGAGDYPDALKAYNDSGQYAKDLNAVGRKAERFVVRRSDRLRDRARERCRKGKGPCKKPKLAIVFDIDETSLSNYDHLAASDFANAGTALATSLLEADSPAIGATQRVYETALDEKLAVFFITGRPAAIPQVQTATETNLQAAGYTRYEELILRDTDAPTIEYKSGKREEIEDDGYDIVANVGDQESDLLGGSADRAFKLPNPYYFIG